MAVAYHVIVSGKVQGVGFRNYIRQKATRLNLTGWVKNLPDGRVEGWIQGPQAAVEEMLIYFKRGPMSSEVFNAEIHSQESALELIGFNVRT